MISGGESLPIDVTIKVDTAPRPSFSRFEINLHSGRDLPIFPLSFPADGKAGVLMVGDYVAQDLVQYMMDEDPDFRNKWIVISTTQSDAIPADCSLVDFNFFTNESGKTKYLSGPAKNVPFSTELGDGHYVDPDFFIPNPEIPKAWDIVYPAKWYPTKNTLVLVEAARLDPTIQIAIYGWPVLSERKIDTSRAYRDLVLEQVRDLKNVTVFDAGFDPSTSSHTNPDGSVVVGNLTKDQMMQQLYWPARASIFLSETTEAINRVCTEMMCCDVPMLVTPTSGGLDKLVTSESGLLIERTPQAILSGVYELRRRANELHPRESFIKNYGKRNANEKLRRIIKEIAEKKGVTVDEDKLVQYGGDLWTPPQIYRQITG